jgi:hypothetical protein
VRVYKTRLFARFARKERISDLALTEAVERAERGLIDADLGGGVIKQRVARQGQGRSGGYRTLIAVRLGDFAVFLFGFAKSERQNIEIDELEDLRTVAGQWLHDPNKLKRDAAAGTLIEVRYAEDD